MVSKPEQSEEMRSLPARDVTMVLCAPDTAKEVKKKEMLSLKDELFILGNRHGMMRRLFEATR